MALRVLWVLKHRNFVVGEFVDHNRSVAERGRPCLMVRRDRCMPLPVDRTTDRGRYVRSVQRSLSLRDRIAAGVEQLRDQPRRFRYCSILLSKVYYRIFGNDDKRVLLQDFLVSGEEHDRPRTVQGFEFVPLAESVPEILV